jgi:hypothetical protein
MVKSGECGACVRLDNGEPSAAGQAGSSSMLSEVTDRPSSIYLFIYLCVIYLRTLSVRIFIAPSDVWIGE